LAVAKLRRVNYIFDELQTRSLSLILRAAESRRTILLESPCQNVARINSEAAATRDSSRKIILILRY
jgi:hypothetical protein